MRKTFLLSLLLLSNIAFGQHAPVRIDAVGSPHGETPETNLQGRIHQGHCATDILRKQIVEKYVQDIYSEPTMNQRILQHVQPRGGGGGVGLLYVPVVVHIIHNNGPENISDQTVLQGIQDLNDAFANAGSYYTPNGFDMGIRFCLAQQDPDGLPTTGITRNVSTLTNVTADNGQDLQLKNIVRWDPTRYVNIWLVNEITSISMGSAVAGYAHLPNAHGTPEDGIVNEARWFGNSTDDSKIHIHEMGHYLGLYHTFEGGCTNNNCQTDGDRVCDTPPDGTSAAYPCGSFPNTCTTDDDDLSANNPFRPVALGGLGDQDDPMEDYMDYGDRACQRSFTDGQGERMRNALQSIRFSLLESEVCQTSCGIGIVGIDTTHTITLVAGQSVQIQSHHVATVPVTFQWVFNGQVISTQQTLSHTFTNADIGQHYLYMDWINAADNCSLRDSILVRVKCDPPAAFSFTPYIIEPGVPVTFDGTNVLATSYAWYLNGAPVSTSASFTHTFANGGVNHIYLVTGNGQCYDTSAVQYLGVGACGSGENNHWVVGGASGNHIDFSSGSPVVTAIPDNGSNALGTIEGMATVSDRNGNLLFYSDGSKLFNRNHQAFFTGMGAGSSSAQGVLIVPDPGNSQVYYVFTAENFGGMSYQTFRGLAYLKVDMTMNGGLGGVSSQYITLLNRCSEKLTATRHCNGTDIWVVAHGFNDNQFYAYLITPAGLQAPVISAVGTSQYANNQIGSQAVGFHKMSPHGDKLFSSTTEMHFAELFDFDNSTGIVSNPYKFPVSIGTNVYSGEFSPDGTKLYFNKVLSKMVYCMDISSGNQQMMSSSITVVGTSNAQSYNGSLQIAPDGKIYMARYDNYVDVINYPNDGPANCGFETDALYLPADGRYGLNNIFVAPRYNGPQIIGPANVCVGQNNVKYKVGCGDNVWEYHGNNGYVVVSQKEVSLSFSNVGVDTLICHRSNTCSGPASDTLIIHVGGNMANLGSDISICSSGSAVLSPGPGFVTTLWSTGVNTPTLTVSQPGTYWVQVTGQGGCIDRDTIIVSTFNSAFDVPDEPVIQVCGNPNVTSYTLHAAQGNFTHIWNNTQSIGLTHTVTLPTAVTRVPITYYNAQGCADRDTFVIQKVTDFPPVNIGNDTLICPGQILVLHRTSAYQYQNYEWSDGSDGQTFTVYQAGTYWLKYQDSICHNWNTDYITVGYHPVPAITLPNSSFTVCANSNFQLDAGTGYTNFVWHDGSTGQYHTVTQPGLYWVEAQAVCQTVRDSVVVNFYDDAIFHPNFPDTIDVCSNSLPYNLQANNTGPLQNYQWSTGSNSLNLLVTQEGEYSLTANYVCGTVSDTTYIRILQQPATLLPPNQTFCDGQTQFVLHGPPNAVNTWSTGVVADSIIVTQTGTYQISSLGPNGCVTVDDISLTFSDLYLEDINDTVMCDGQSISINPNTNASVLFGPSGPITLPLIVSDTGNYLIYAYENNCFVYTSFHVGEGSSQSFDLHMTDTLFACSNTLPMQLGVDDSFYSYLWNTGAQTSSITVTQGGMYSVVANDGCSESKDSTYLVVHTSPVVSLPSATDTLCPGESIVLQASPLYNNLWSTGSNADSITVYQAGTYWLTSVLAGCSASDTIAIVDSDLFMQPIPDGGLCKDGSITVEAVTNGEEILWSNGQTSAAVTLTQPGNYWVEASLGDCQTTETFTITQWPAPTFSLGNDIAVPNGPVTIGINDIFESYTWNVPGNTSTISINSPGIYILTATNAEGCTYSDTIRVYFTAGISGNKNDDTYLYVPQILSPAQGPLIAQYAGIELRSVIVYDATGKTISHTNNFPTIWDGNTGSGAAAATGTYYYTLHYNTISGKQGVHHGKVLLMQ